MEETAQGGSTREEMEERGDSTREEMEERGDSMDPDDESLSSTDEDAIDAWDPEYEPEPSDSEDEEMEEREDTLTLDGSIVSNLTDTDASSTTWNDEHNLRVAVAEIC